MGNPKQKWTAEEEEALRAGILKYGPGKWKFIQRDPEFNKHLYSRSNIDLKDKWRNMSAAAGQGSREKSRAPKPKNPDCTVTPNVNCQTSAPLPVANDSHADLVKDEQSKDAKNRYNAMVIEALSATKQPNGLDITSLMSYIEQRVDEVPQNFRKLLGSRLRRLVARDELEKIDNCYRIKDASSLSEAKPAIVQETQPIQTSQPTPNPSVSREIFKKSATLAALSIVKGEDLSFQLAEAVREVERITKMVEEEDDILKLADAIHEICSRGKTVPIA